MKKISPATIIIGFLIISNSVFACTNLLVSPGASKDGSSFLVYLNDGEWLYHLNQTPAQDHDISDSLTFRSMSGKSFKIHQVAHTYAIIGFQMNEHQLSIGETTFLGREELWDKEQPLKYWELMRLALLRAKTAREAIKVMTSLADTYGYGSEGETFSLADPREAWLLEMIGTGGKGGAVWVARRVPDGYITAHANHSRIGRVPTDDPENCLYSDNYKQFAIDAGIFNPNEGVDFRFNDVYDPPSTAHLKYTETRVWSIFRRAAPSQEFSSAYNRNLKGSETYPLFIKPDKKLSLKDVFSLIRDHYEGTEFDMRKDMAAGPSGNPNRPRPLEWEINAARYSWERPVSTYNTAFSFVAQMREFLPDEIGGICWFAVDDTYTNCYFPIYCNNTQIPEAFTKGDIKHYSPESAWWAFNYVANFAMLRYNLMVEDIKSVQQTLEDGFINQQKGIETAALSLDKQDRIDFLSAYSAYAGRKVHKAWVELGELLVSKYNDGYVKDPENNIISKSYSKEYLNKIVEQEGDRYKIDD
ncbi:MAG: dipeptidase [Chlorobi bacterium]|nr:dipeptidase [Chlorobiota bacterium]